MHQICDDCLFVVDEKQVSPWFEFRSFHSMAKVFDSFTCDHRQKVSVSTMSSSVQTCAGCMTAIKEKYLLKAVDKFWHTTCLKCCECGVVLEQVGKSCFVKGTAILCRYDYMR